MHRFGPFLTLNSGHMDMLIRRLVALMLQLRGPQADPARAFPAPSQFFLNNGTPKPKARSWPRREVSRLEEWEQYRQDNPRKQQGSGLQRRVGGSAH